MWACAYAICMCQGIALSSLPTCPAGHRQLASLHGGAACRSAWISLWQVATETALVSVTLSPSTCQLVSLCDAAGAQE
eukprot:366009-Chlamydomonas_euryale.AAC.21